MDRFIAEMVVVVSLVETYLQTHQAVYREYIQPFACQSELIVFCFLFLFFKRKNRKKGKERKEKERKKRASTV